MKKNSFLGILFGFVLLTLTTSCSKEDESLTPVLPEEEIVAPPQVASFMDKVGALTDGQFYETTPNPDYLFEVTKDTHPNGQTRLSIDYCGPTKGYDIHFFRHLSEVENVHSGVYNGIRSNELYCCMSSSTTLIALWGQMYLRAISRATNEDGSPVFDKIYYFTK